jgi:hypothetical protein
MKTSSLLFPALTLSTLLAGCVGVGPNTQRDAVSGGALGALAGAIIGNNSRGGDALGGALLGGELGALAGGTLGNSVDHQQGTLYGRSPDYASARAVTYAPPPPPPAPAQTPEAVPPPPTADAVWISGYWSFDGRAYTWLAGHWEVPPPDAHTYVAAHWDNHDSPNRYIPGYWQ